MADFTTTNRVDIFNIVIVVFSFFLAVRVPFELFLISYALLGPLHYLTEIVWLKERNFFFTAKKYWGLVFVVIAILFSIYPAVKYFDIHLVEGVKTFVSVLGKQLNSLLLACLLFSIGLIYFKKTKTLFVILLVSLLISYYLGLMFPKYFLLIGLFLPTLIHVYLFTLFFIIYGAIKSKSKQGMYLAALVIIVPIIIMYIPINLLEYKPSKDTIASFIETNIVSVSVKIASIFGGTETENFYFLSETGVRLQIFIAFAYTYHYLNWFSKISIIGWGKSISSAKLKVVLGLWVLFVALYLYDYKAGFISLFFLSFLHVFLEFPLNFISIKGILKGRK